MDVVATRAGKYGRTRARGDQFTLRAKGDFSERWMAKAGTKEADAVLAEVRDDGLTRAQIEAERANATGKGAHRAELAAKDARIADLEGEIEVLLGKLKDAGAEKAPAADEEPSSTPGPDDGEKSTDDTPPTRTTRRRRS